MSISVRRAETAKTRVYYRFSDVALRAYLFRADLLTFNEASPTEKRERSERERKR